jgi:hypothetical protein
MAMRFSAILIASALGLGAASLFWSALPAPAPSAPVIVPAPTVGEGERVRYPEGRLPKVVSADGREHEIRSVLNISRPMNFGDYVWTDEGVPAGDLWVRVDIDKQVISVFRDGHEIASAVILFGAEGKPSPVGAFTVLQKAKDYHSRTYDAPMPFMLRLTDDGVAIHASSVKEGWATHGCIGVPMEFARRLFALAKLGDSVEIVSSSKT